MRKIQLMVYVMVVLITLADEQGIPIMPAIWHYNSRFWYGLSRFAGRAGLAAEDRYYRSMETVNG